MTLLLWRRSGWFKRHTTRHVQRCQVKRSSVATNAAENLHKPNLATIVHERLGTQLCKGQRALVRQCAGRAYPTSLQRGIGTSNQRGARGAKAMASKSLFSLTIEFDVPIPRKVQLLPYLVGTVHARAATR
jgi:hypothetical protein